MTIHYHDFMESPTFKAAYQRGVKAAGTGYHWHWRVHIRLWAAAMASRLAGDANREGGHVRFLKMLMFNIQDVRIRPKHMSYAIR
jgi:hypothetical protein